jgi:hypothetical protein
MRLRSMLGQIVMKNDLVYLHLAMSQITAYRYPHQSVKNSMTDQNMAVDDLEVFAIITYIRGYTRRLL